MTALALLDMPTADAELAQLLPEGVEPPDDIPPDIFEAALRTFLELRRLDMRALAGELGIGRATLYRRVGGRDHLLGAVVWFLTRHAIARAVKAGAGLAGRERLAAVNAGFMHDVNRQPGFRRFLDAEPEAALRILTSKHGPIQRGVIDWVARLLAQEEERGAIAPDVDLETLAYVIVRVGESFLYADVIADNEPDVDLAVDVIGKLY
jgi:AcrR family transcriptional regulator